MISDGLACFKAVKEANCEHLGVVTGGNLGLLDHPAFNWVSTMIGNVKNSLRGSCHKLGAKHLPREGANKRGNSSRLTQSFHFFMFEPFFLP